MLCLSTSVILFLNTGVLGETPQIFPAASDYHLLCLQHDDSAEMIVDGRLSGCFICMQVQDSVCKSLYMQAHILVRQSASLLVRHFLLSGSTAVNSVSDQPVVWQSAGTSYYSSQSDATLPTGPGFKQYCVPIPLAPGKSPHGLIPLAGLTCMHHSTQRKVLQLSSSYVVLVLRTPSALQGQGSS